MIIQLAHATFGHGSVCILLYITMCTHSYAVSHTDVTRYSYTCNIEQLCCAVVIHNEVHLWGMYRYGFSYICIKALAVYWSLSHAGLISHL